MSYKIKNKATITRPLPPPPMQSQKAANEAVKTTDKPHVEGWLQEVESLTRMRLATQGIIDQIQTTMDEYIDQMDKKGSNLGRVKLEDDAILMIMSECKSKLMLINKVVSVSYSFLTGLRPA